jgi:adenosylcobinamide kinase / adenosylcobinamide-phosphate guanylyltransferase
MTHELILGGARSGKSRAAEHRAAQWLAEPGQEAVLIATALAGDAEMALRIARHQADRARRVPRLGCVELQGGDLAQAVRTLSTPRCLVLVDCLTLWLTGLLMPLRGTPATPPQLEQAQHDLRAALDAARGRVVLVSNEIGLGVLPMGAATRQFVDALGRLHQEVAAACGRVTLMVAGCALAVKSPAQEPLS